MDIDVSEYEKKLTELARYLKVRYSLHLEVPLLVSAGQEALLELAHAGKHDATRRDFWAYAYKNVRGKMLQEVSNHTGQSRKWLAAARAHRDACLASGPVPGERPARGDASESDPRREAFMNRMNVIEATPIRYALLEMSEDQTSLGRSPESILLEAETRGRLQASVEALPEPQRTMLLQRYVEGLSLKDVGRNFGISESRTCTLISEARRHILVELEPSS